MDKLVSLVANAATTRSKNDDETVDRFSSRYTVVILIGFAIFVSMNQYVRNPLACWAPKQFHGSHVKYMSNYCWVSGSYHVPWNEEVSKPESRQDVFFYQWIPFILLGQAMLFYVPSVVWHFFNDKSGVDSDDILESAHSLQNAKSEEKQRFKTLRMITRQIDRFLLARKKSKGCCRWMSIFSRRNGSYLLFLFLLSKCLYIANAFVQLFFIGHVFGIKFSSFGIDMMSQYIQDDDWTEKEFVAFPRVTYCDFRIRGQDMANVQNNTVQCVLTVNMYNEKMLTFLWFWIVFILVTSIVNLLVWLFRALMRSDRRKFVQNRLGACLLTNNDSFLVPAFVNYLGQDGVLLLRLMAHNVNHIITTDVVCDLWEYWKINHSRSSSLDVKNLYTPPELNEMKKLKEDV